MITFPNAKINLGLNIVSKRPDGYHDIETVFYPVGIKDALEMVKTAADDTTLVVSGMTVTADAEKNLVMKACRRMQQRYGLPPVSIFLHKAIPFGAGLGGGSSDAAHMLLMLRDYFQLPLSDDELAAEAAALGADCPFFIYNKPLMAKGIGNEFSPVSLSLKGYYLVLVKPEVVVSTADAYAQVVPELPEIPISELIARPVEEWRGTLVNDFEKSVFPAYPQIAMIKQLLYDNGAVYASMSGSGASVFGLFTSSKNLESKFPGCTVWGGACEI